MKKYLFQRFLPREDTDKISLSELYAEEIGNQKVISLSLLDEIIDTEKDLDDFLNQFDPSDSLVLNDDRPPCSNVIIREYADKTLKSYLLWIKDKGFACSWSKV